jgi:tRNA threonylcarbamoyladenosine biosynthesis protein TsaE
LHGGETIELISDLGGGKTTFTRGLARGFGSTDRVASPTFTISRIYKAPEGREMHHFDFYRLQEAGLISEELADVVNDPQIVIVVEWAGIVQDVLPEERLTITIEKTPDDERIIRLQAPKALAYLINEAKHE